MFIDSHPRAGSLQPDTVYYSNSDNLPGSRKSRELLDAFFHTFSKNINSKKTLNFFRNTRIPNERELYGLFIESLLTSPFDGERGYIATELKIGRSDDDKGRVDFFFNYRNVSFLIEFKVRQVGIEGAKGTPEDEPDGIQTPSQRILKPWYGRGSKGNEIGVVSQLKNLEVESIGDKHEVVIKIPMVLYLYVDWRTNEPQPNKDKLKNCLDNMYSHIWNTLTTSAPPCLPQFQLYSILDESIRTRKRSASLEIDPNMTLYGFSLVAGSF